MAFLGDHQHAGDGGAEDIVRAESHLGGGLADGCDPDRAGLHRVRAQSARHTTATRDSRHARLKELEQQPAARICGAQTAVWPMTLSLPRRPRRSVLAVSERSICRRSRYSGVTSPVTYSPEKQDVSNSTMRASSCLQAATRSSRS